MAARPAFARHDLLTWPLVGPFLRWRFSRRFLQAVLLAVSALILFDGFLGPQQSPKNLATVTVWIHYRGLVVLALLLVGNLFCMACPFMLPREAARWLGRRLGLQRNVPRPLRSKWPAVILLALFFYLFELYDLWASPWLTAWVIATYFLTALVIDLFFRGAAFCKYVCPLGQFNFMAALASPGEIRVREAAVCTTCRTKDCIAGNRQTGQRGCELWLFQPGKVGNMDCTFCLDCVYACPHDNIGLLARLPTQELWSDPRRAGIGRLGRRLDVTALLVVLIFGAYLNAFGMIKPVYALEQWLAARLHTTAEAPVLLLIFGVGLGVVPPLLLATAGWLSRLASGRRESVRETAQYFILSLVPLGFGMWLAHYAFHFLTGALTLIPVTQSFLNDIGLPAGEPLWQLGPIVPADWLFPLQAFFLYLGTFGSLVAAFQLAVSRYRTRQVALRAFLPWAALTLVMLVAALWIMFQPMEMRGTIFLGL
ncbi:MAG: FesM [Chloroflexi bacterium]|nr:MAG: FesM [Chloroflexota bacterium]